MEGQQERRNVGEIEPVGGQPSRNSGQTGLEPEEHTIDIGEISDEDWIKFLRTAEESTQSQSQWPRIPKVPQMLRGTQDFKKFYEPRVISIGPYHNGKPHLYPGEMIKPLCARNFLDDSKQDIEALYTKIRSNIKAVKECYDWSSTKKYDDKKLARMILLDGCFVLQFIRGKVMRKFLRNHQISFVEEDLFLLENQLPYGVLKLIFKGANFQGGLPMEKNIKKFITVIGMPEGLSSEIHLEEVNEEPSHLLDLLRSALLGRFKMIRGSQPEQEQEAEKKGEESSSSGGGNGGSQPEQEQEAEKKGELSSSSGGGNGGSQPEQVEVTDIGMPEGLSQKIQLKEENEEPSHLLDLLRSALLGRYKKISKQELGSQPEQEQEAEKNGESSSSRGRDGGFCCSWKKGKQQGNWASFRHIKELKAAGIYVKPSRTSFLTDISFKSYFFCRYLKLPQIIIDDFTKSKFLNMVAYEMCRDAPDDYTVTSYVCFLNELIYDADDVKELRSKHILYNRLGSDEDVVKIFNEIADGLVDPNAFIDVKARIKKHYYKRVNTWIAGGLQEYFRYPWSFTGFIAAVWILILTSLQTYYAHPGKQMMIIYMGLFGVPIFLLVVWYIVRLLRD